jgi:predicted nucleic acid-binding protein
MARTRGSLIMDANVLIDFCEADRTILRLVSEHIGPVHVPIPILREEVQELLADEDHAELGIVPIEPTLEVATEAAGRRAGLSFYDQLCLVLARDNGWTCVTNDGRLRRECEVESVPVLWGLETIALLVDAEVLPVAEAERIGRAIQRSNPRFITDRIMLGFLDRIGAGPKKPSPKPRRPR